MGMQGALNVAAAAGGIAAGLDLGYRIKETKADIDFKKEESKRRDGDKEYLEELASIGADDGIDAAVEPPEGMPPSKEGMPTGPEAYPDGTEMPEPGSGLPEGGRPKVGETPLGEVGGLPVDENGEPISLGKWRNAPDYLKTYQADILENEQRARVATKHGKIRDAMRYREEARRVARMAETALDPSLSDVERRMRLGKDAEERRTRAMVDGFDLAMAGDLANAENVIAQGSETKHWPKPGSLKVDKEKGIVEYVTESGQGRRFTRAYRDVQARNLPSSRQDGTGKTGSPKNVTREAISYREQLRTEIKELQQGLVVNPPVSTPAKKGKGWFGKDQEAVEDKDAIKAIRDEIAEKKQTLKELDKQIKQGLDTGLPSSEEDAGAEDGSGEDPSAAAGEGAASEMPEFKSGREAAEWIQANYPDRIGSGEVIDVVVNGKTIPAKL